MVLGLCAAFAHRHTHQTYTHTHSHIIRSACAAAAATRHERWRHSGSSSNFLSAPKIGTRSFELALVRSNREAHGEGDAGGGGFGLQTRRGTGGLNRRYQSSDKPTTCALHQTYTAQLRQHSIVSTHDTRRHTPYAAARARARARKTLKHRAAIREIRSRNRVRARTHTFLQSVYVYIILYVFIGMCR